MNREHSTDELFNLQKTRLSLCASGWFKNKEWTEPTSRAKPRGFDERQASMELLPIDSESDFVLREP